MSVTSILGPDGVIAERLPGYEPRPQQLDMAHAVADAFADRRHLMVEAGTGVGKSFAYLVPAVQFATRARENRVVISTHTISLQEQLVHKDVPFLQEVMPEPFQATLVKGRSNYLSLRRLRVAQQRASSLFADSALTNQLTQIGRWSRQTRDGSRSDLRFTPLPAVWDLVESDSSNCLGRACPDHGDCFYYQARKQALGAHVLIVNHALFFRDLALRRQGVNFLPDYKVVIFDEAHTVEEVAADHLGLSFNAGSLHHLLNRLFHVRTGRGLLATLPAEDAVQQVQTTRVTGDDFFRSLAEWMAKQPRSTRPGAPSVAQSVLVSEPNIIPDVLTPQLIALAEAVEGVGAELDVEQRIEFLSLGARARAMAKTVLEWLGRTLEGQVYWVEQTGGANPRLELASAPIEVGPILREALYDQGATVVMTSATLSVGGDRGFAYFQDRLGLPGCDTLQLGSPFDYRTQVELHLFRKMPDPSNDPAAYEQAVLERLPDCIEHTRGRAFVLFTSNSMMQRAADRLRSWCQQKGYPLLSQSDGLPRTQMIERFRAAGNAVLLGVDSFWQGVDVPGEALSNVIITKLPFVVPDRPVVAARQEAIEAAGGHSFFDYQVPQAVLKLKQGFGRLVRRASDRGVVFILDPRVMTKGYGRSFLAALPECRRFVDGAPAEDEEAPAPRKRRPS